MDASKSTIKVVRKCLLPEFAKHEESNECIEEAFVTIIVEKVSHEFTAVSILIFESSQNSS